MVEAGLRHIKILEELDFTNIALSLKASDLNLCIESYEEAANTINYPLHLGVTHAGTEFSGTISSSIGLGILLKEGISIRQLSRITGVNRTSIERVSRKMHI